MIGDSERFENELSEISRFFIRMAFKFENEDVLHTSTLGRFLVSFFRYSSIFFVVAQIREEFLFLLQEEFSSKNLPLRNKACLCRSQIQIRRVKKCITSSNIQKHISRRLKNKRNYVKNANLWLNIEAQELIFTSED